METMFFPDEVRPVAAIQGLDQVGEPEVRELSMARTLIDSLAAPFDPGKYRDRYRDRLLELIRAKAAGREVVTAPAPETARVVDLMEALRESIALAEQERARQPLHQ